MSTATYPDDAIAPITAFSVIGTTTYNNTGAAQLLSSHMRSMLNRKSEWVTMVGQVGG